MIATSSRGARGGRPRARLEQRIRKRIVDTHVRVLLEEPSLPVDVMVHALGNPAVPHSPVVLETNVVVAQCGVLQQTEKQQIPPVHPELLRRGVSPGGADDEDRLAPPRSLVEATQVEAAASQ